MNDDIYVDPTPTCRVCFDLGSNTFWIEACKRGEITVSELRDSAARGCVGCSILFRILNEAKRECFRWSIPLHYNSNCALQIGDVRIQVYNLPGMCAAIVYSPLLHRGLTEKGAHCPYPRLRYTNPISYDTASEAAFSTLKGWIRHCDESHDSCQSRLQSTKLPTRIVEILGPRKIRLRETKDETSSYTCLSYCWGVESFIRTTTASLASHKASILWEALPKTHQDAIDITSRLGFSYVCIDSLCIVQVSISHTTAVTNTDCGQQDDLNDWRHEGGKMDQIYSHSSLTIAASKSKNPSEGCYMACDDGFSKTYWFSNAADEDFAIYARQIISHDIYAYQRKDGNHEFPLMQRGWAFQERYLSPRIVHFGPQELLWECQVESSCECSGRDQGANTDLGRAKRQRQDWHRIVEQYSKRTLKFDQDIFPALQGIAKSMGQNRAYFAGVWNDSVIEDLLWCSLTATRPEEWRAPTWSWASVKGSVYFNPLGRYDPEILASVVSIKAVPAGSDPFGQLKSAQITLKGCCLSMQLDCEREQLGGLSLSYQLGSDDMSTVFSRRPKASKNRIRIIKDCDLNRFYGRTVEVMAIARHPPKKTSNAALYHMAFVRVNDLPEIYERIALVHNFPMDGIEHGLKELFAREGQEKTLTII